MLDLSHQDWEKAALPATKLHKSLFFPPLLCPGVVSALLSVGSPTIDLLLCSSDSFLKKSQKWENYFQMGQKNLGVWAFRGTTELFCPSALSRTAPFRGRVSLLGFLLLSKSTGDTGGGRGRIPRGSCAAWGFSFSSHTWMEKASCLMKILLSAAVTGQVLFFKSRTGCWVAQNAFYFVLPQWFVGSWHWGLMLWSLPPSKRWGRVVSQAVAHWPCGEIWSKNQCYRVSGGSLKFPLSVKCREGIVSLQFVKLRASKPNIQANEHSRNGFWGNN